MTVAPTVPAGGLSPDLGQSPEVDHPRPLAGDAGPGSAPDVVFADPGSEDPLWGESDVALLQKQHPDRREAPNRGGKYPAQVLTAAEVSALIAGCSTRSVTGIRNRALLTLMYRSGLRVSEVLGLRLSDINPADHSIRVRHTKSQEAQTRAFSTLADDSLTRWLDVRRAQGLARSGVPLFCTTKGGELLPTYVRNLMRRLAVAAGIEKRVHPHGLRHSFAAEMQEAGEHVTTISKALGHSNIGVTARYLDHLTNGEAVKRVAAANLPRMEVDG